MKVKITEIKVKNRFREDYGDIESLTLSISRLGLLHPIILTKDNELIAGERRLKAHKELGLDEIECNYYEDCDELTKKEIELEEHIARKNFSWGEEVTAKAELDNLKRALYGSAPVGVVNPKEGSGKWGIKQTADALGESVGTISQDIRLAKALIDFPELRKEKTKNAAWKRYQRLLERAMTGEMASRMVAEINEADIKKGNCITIMKKMKDESIDLIVSDPPFGVGLDKAGAHKDKWGGDVYSDDTNKVMETLEKAFPEMYRLLKPNSHAYIFFAMTHYVKVLKMLEDSGFQVVLTPIIWNKASQGAPPETPYSYVQTYEPCFLCHKGKRALNEYVTNVLTIPRVPSAKKIHVAQKPVSLLRKFIEASSIAGEIVLDPFMGSGSTVIAAYECKRKAIGIEKDEDMFNKVLLRIQEFKEEYK